MKRIIVIALLPVFMLTAVGIRYVSLYCDGKLSSKGISLHSCCKLKDCCDLKSEYFKIKDAYEASSYLLKLSKPEILFYKGDFIHSRIVSVLYGHHNIYIDEGDGPPLLPVSRNVLYCSFLI